MAVFLDAFPDGNFLRFIFEYCWIALAYIWVLLVLGFWDILRIIQTCLRLFKYGFTSVDLGRYGQHSFFEPTAATLYDTTEGEMFTFI